jgi:putative transposase
VSTPIPEGWWKLAGGASHRCSDINSSEPRQGRGRSICMSSTHLSLHYHIVFGTKNHEPTIQPEWRGALHAYLGGIIRTANGFPESIGGVADHVHLLIGLRATHCLADVLRDLKAVSSGWIHDEIGAPRFGWQEGYGAFTVSPSQRETVRRYIEQQPEHHRTRTFREEYLELLRRSGVEFDERYL